MIVRRFIALGLVERELHPHGEVGLGVAACQAGLNEHVGQVPQGVQFQAGHVLGLRHLIGCHLLAKVD